MTRTELSKLDRRTLDAVRKALRAEEESVRSTRKQTLYDLECASEATKTRALCYWDGQLRGLERAIRTLGGRV